MRSVVEGSLQFGSKTNITYKIDSDTRSVRKIDEPYGGDTVRSILC